MSLLAFQDKIIDIWSQEIRLQQYKMSNENFKQKENRRRAEYNGASSCTAQIQGGELYSIMQSTAP